MVQSILVYIALGLALFFLIKKFFFKSKKNTGCNTDCGC
ncbi:FeoB-associated Cys-rich membrane protein [Aureibaculum sp. 2210JD6-5]|nr:FeoB-associated Cys-rich membrane protein [Aureibaculum sp. 2210JD6-5]MDY7395746.1 FeoB-associated Cys-rich membrane protein [Aureibaculum sp. 2210JD6-5]